MIDQSLDCLLAPKSIALVGASDRADSPGNTAVQLLKQSHFQGASYLVNPRLTKIGSHCCFSSLEELPQPVEHVIIALRSCLLEPALHAAIQHGAKAATIFANGVLEDDSEPTLRQRLLNLAKAHRILICGINGMGFYNIIEDLSIGLFPRPRAVPAGGISFIAQSGSAFATLPHNGNRLGFNLCVSTGDEITTDVADYMQWALLQDSTSVIALFIETIRHPGKFIAALQQAQSQNIPVVVLKIGKSPLGASMAITHTGAIAGNHMVLQAVFKRYQVLEVDTFDQMRALLSVLQYQRRLPLGQFAAVFESGGFRELVADRAHALHVEFATLSDTTKQAMAQYLDPGLLAENPLDAWGSPEGFGERFEACFKLMVDDDNVAACVFFTNFRDNYYLSDAIANAVLAVSRQTDKPVALATCYSDLDNAGICQRAREACVPLIDGIDETLVSFKRLFEYRDSGHALMTHQTSIAAHQAERPAAQSVHRMGEIGINTQAGDVLQERDALSLLARSGIPVCKHTVISCVEELQEACSHIAFPVVLKTAEDTIHHKSDSGGVVLDIRNEAQLFQNYADFSARLGPKALLAEMITGGVEVALGIINDMGFGPIILLSAGGVEVELFDDRTTALCPVTHAEADQLLKSLKINQLLNGFRGRPPCDRQALVQVIVTLSEFAIRWSDSIKEIDINPVMVTERAAVAVDALIHLR